MITLCNLCKKEYYVRPSRFLKNKHNFCSKECLYKSMPLMDYTKETKTKMSLAKKGKKFTNEHRKNLSLSHKGQMPSNIEQLKSGIYSKKIGLANKGKKRTIEQRKKMSESRKGDKCHLWKGGITKINSQIRNSLEYRLWRESVFKRDGFMCQFCKQKSKKGKRITLNADHIKPFADYPELRFAIDNGRTLCVECHKKTDSYLNRWLIKTKTL